VNLIMGRDLPPRYNIYTLYCISVSNTKYIMLVVKKLGVPRQVLNNNNKRQKEKIFISHAVGFVWC
jgi:hypothetical protein